MPHKPKHPCAYPGCPELTYERYCPEHKKLTDAQYDKFDRDKTAAEFYRSSAWRHTRENYLIDHPFCEECQKRGRLTKATLVDHIIPIRQGGPTLDENNLQALCSSCHSAKSIKEGSRFGRKYSTRK